MDRKASQPAAGGNHWWERDRIRAPEGSLQALRCHKRRHFFPKPFSHFSTSILPIYPEDLRSICGPSEVWKQDGSHSGKWLLSSNHFLLGQIVLSPTSFTVPLDCFQKEKNKNYNRLQKPCTLEDDGVISSSAERKPKECFYYQSQE